MQWSRSTETEPGGTQQGMIPLQYVCTKYRLADKKYRLLSSAKTLGDVSDRQPVGTPQVLLLLSSFSELARLFIRSECQSQVPCSDVTS